MKGYSTTFVNEVKEADKSKLGVLFGIACIKKDIPVTDVASFFEVSRMTVYSWFRGKTNVPQKHKEKMQKLVDKLSQLYEGLGQLPKRMERRHIPAHSF